LETANPPGLTRACGTQLAVGNQKLGAAKAVVGGEPEVPPGHDISSPCTFSKVSITFIGKSDI
jgi:hypothetical protein